MRRSSFAASVLATASVLGAATPVPPAFAQTAVAPADARRAVVVTFAGPADLRPALEASLRELLARHHLVLAAPGEAGADAVLARVQIDLSSSSQAVVLLTDGRTGEARALRAIPRDPSPSIAREEIAHAVDSAVESELLVDRPETSAPAPSPAPAPSSAPPPPAPTSTVGPAPPPPPVILQPAPRPREEPSAPSTSSSPFALDLTTLAGAGGFSSSTGPDARVGGGIVASSRSGVRPSLSITGLYTLPFQAQGPIVGSQTNLVSLRAVPGVEVFRARWIALDVGAGGGVDVLSVAPRSESFYASLGTSTSRVDPILTGTVGAQVALATGVVLVVAAAADVDLASRRYVLDQGGSEVAIMSPWRVRPLGLVGLAFTAVGEPLFARGAP